MREADRGADARLAELSATDRLTLVYLAALAIAALVLDVPRAALLGGIAAVALAILATARASARSRLGRWLHDFLPVANVILLFNLSGPVIAASPAGRGDASLAALDRALFGALPTAWFGLLGRPAWLVDAAAIVYFSYYLIPVAIGAALYRAGRRADFERMVFTVVATFLLSYLLYFAAPSLGPRVPPGREAEVLGGGALNRALLSFLHATEWNALDAFPSGHTAVSLVLLGLTWQMLPRWRAPMVALVAGIVFSTVYLSLHYVVDLVAGALLAALMPFAAPVLHQMMSPRSRSLAQPS